MRDPQRKAALGMELAGKLQAKGLLFWVTALYAVTFGDMKTLCLLAANLAFEKCTGKRAEAGFGHRRSSILYYFSWLIAGWQYSTADEDVTVNNMKKIVNFFLMSAFCLGESCAISGHYKITHHK